MPHNIVVIVVGRELRKLRCQALRRETVLGAGRDPKELACASTINSVLDLHDDRP